MRYRKLGKTDIEVSIIAFGGWGIIGGSYWGAQEEKDSRAALRAAFDAGVTFFDTAEGYGAGKSEQLIGTAFHDVRDKIVIASKVSVNHFVPAKLRQACERSLQALQTDYIDLYQLHWPSRTVPIADVFATLDKLQKEGKIRAYGVSNFGKQDMEKCSAAGRNIISNQLAYNLLFRAIEYEILPYCLRKQISILCYSPLLQGLLSGKYSTPEDVPVDRARTRHFSRARQYARHGEAGCEELTFETLAEIKRIAGESGQSMSAIAVAWLLAQDGVTAAIVGGRNAEQARKNAQAADIVLPREILKRLTRATKSLKQRLGPNADMWQSDSRIH